MAHVELGAIDVECEGPITETRRGDRRSDPFAPQHWHTVAVLISAVLIIVVVIASGSGSPEQWSVESRDAGRGGRIRHTARPPASFPVRLLHANPPHQPPRCAEACRTPTTSLRYCPGPLPWATALHCVRVHIHACPTPPPIAPMLAKSKKLRCPRSRASTLRPRSTQRPARP